jgi:hypothetical protein
VLLELLALGQVREATCDVMTQACVSDSISFWLSTGGDEYWGDEYSSPGAVVVGWGSVMAVQPRVAAVIAV